MNLSELSLDALLKLNDNPDFRVRFHGRDLADHFVIVEDSRRYDERRYSESHFYLYVEDDLETPTVYERCDTMVEAALHLAHAFVIDNCDGADANNPDIEQRHDALQGALRNLVE